MYGYTIGSIKVSSTVITGLVDSAINSNLQQLLLSGSGHIENGFAATGRATPDMAFTTMAIKTALANLGGADGLVFTDSSVTAWLQRTDGTITRSGALHAKATCVAGLFVPQTLTIPAGAAATISYIILLVSADGTTVPIGIATGQALDASDGPGDEAYTLGAVALNGTTLGDVSSVTVNFGLLTAQYGGTMYPTNADIYKRQPLITIATNDVAVPIGWGITGTAQTTTDSTIVLDDVVSGASRGTSPITLTLDEGLISPTAIGGSDGAAASAGIEYKPIWDGTADAIAISGIS